MSTKQLTECQVRWMVLRDMPEVLDIERHSFSYPWDYHEFKAELKRMSVIGMVADVGERVAGFIIYELLKGQLHILNLAVHQEFRRQQIGSQMLEKIAFKLIQQKRNESIVHVREVNLAAQKFFAANGYLAECIVPEFYDDPVEDAIRFYRMRHE